VLLTVAVLVLLGSAVAQTPKVEKVALLVGVTEYDHSKLGNLQYAEADVEELADVLRQSGYSRVVLLTSRAGIRDKRLVPERDNIQRELAALLAKRTKRDTVLVAFSGHGVQLTVKGKDEPFFCPRDGNPTKPDTLVALNQVYTELDDSGAGVKLLLVDACRNNPADKGSKGIDGKNLPEMREGMGALFSCKPGERSYEHKDWKHGAFFAAVLEGLRPGSNGRLAADGDGDGVVDFGELSRHVSKQVPTRVRKTLGEGVEQHPLPVQTIDPLVPLVHQVKMLLDGKSLEGWVKRDGQPAEWKVKDGYVECVPGTGNILTREKFGPDFELHVEFWLPLVKDAQGQKRANSGIFLQGRYEVQVLDSYMNDTFANGSVGALFGLLAPDATAQQKAIKPPEQWNSYDITFHAPRVDDQGRVSEKGRVTVKLNGFTLIDNGPFDRTTSTTAIDERLGEPGPIMLQDYDVYARGFGSPVRYRNIWLKPLRE
jgi:hypothetical protein